LFKIIALISIVLLPQYVWAFDVNPERRKDQNPTVPAYLMVPLPYSLPGIGSGFLFMGNVSNVMGSTADISILQATGDASGTIANGVEIPLYFEWLSLDFMYQNINKAAINNYSKRGMNSTTKNDFNILELSLARTLNTTLNFEFFDKRLNFYYSRSHSSHQIDALRDSEGNLIQTLNYEGSSQSDHFSTQLDLTDDHLDPRNGLRVSLTYRDHADQDVDAAKFYTLDYRAKAYFPMGDTSTLVLNYFQSDAHVTTEGNLDPAAIRASLNTNCAPADTTCLQAEQGLVDMFTNERRYGTATDLGGDQGLRSFPGNRYRGAHSALFGVEFRWNITQEATPFDYFVWKDVRTGIQYAFFAELGTVSEVSNDLWTETRYSVGTGVRLITGSGGVYRADIATGNEGAELSVIFDYPWR